MGVFILSEGDIDTIGVTNFTLTMKVEDQNILILNENYSNPVNSFIKKGQALIFDRETVYASGNIKIKYNDMGNIKIESLNYYISHFLLISPYRVTYYLEIPLYWLRILDISGIFILTVLLIKKIKSYFSRTSYYSKKTKQRDKEFWEYIRQRKEENEKSNF